MKRTFAVLMTIVGLLLVSVNAPSQAHAQSADDPAQAAAGQAVYETSCAGCHGDEGEGVAGRGRSLMGIAEQGDRATHIATITDGKGGMPAFGDRLSVDEIDQAASYVRLTFVDAPAEANATELAMTGMNSEALALIGIAMLVGGLQLVVWSRRSLIET